MAPQSSNWRSFFATDGDRLLLDWVWKAELVVGVLLVLLDHYNVRIPYGRYGSDGKWRGVLAFVKALKLPARLAWFVQELPAFVVPLVFVLNVGGRYVGVFNPNIVLLGMFLLHYFNR